jgi:hypothetical protein
MNEATPDTAGVPAGKAPLTCANCGARLEGAYCASCGQPVKGMIRPLSGIMADVVDSVFNIDSRILRTVGPLLFLPGRLTNDYFAGRRTRYVTPFRLFFFMTVVAFFMVQWYLDQGGLKDFKFNLDNNAIERAANVEEVNAQLAEKIAELEKSKAEMQASMNDASVPEPGRAGMRAGMQSGIAAMDTAIANMRKRADERIAWIQKRDEAKSQGLPIPPFISSVLKQSDIENGEEGNLMFNGKAWDPEKNPLTFDWLPDVANRKLNELVGNARENIKRGAREPKRLVAGLLSVLPQTLFVLMPLFAVLLKFFYIFKRRLYMEHLIVALHSHAFISFCLLLISIFGLVKSFWPAFGPVGGALITATTCWMPVYLFLVQKRVYKQGWIMTTLKYGVIGLCYSVLVSVAVAIAMVASLAIAG